MEKELTVAVNWLKEGKDIVLAAVTKTWGSAPRPVGSLMIIHENGQFEGSVSGGCVEGTVISEGLALVGTKTNKLLEFTVASEDAWQVGLACGGQIQIQVFPLTPAVLPTFEETLAHIANRGSGQMSLTKHPVCATFLPDRSPELREPALLETEESIHLRISPPPALYIVGAVHIAQALAPMAKACGYVVTIIDPRGIFVEDRAFEGASIVQDWPDEFFAETKFDSASALVTLTHDPKIDDAALIPALNSNIFYIGALGSKKTHAARLNRLEKQGVAADNLDRIHGPIGLNIGSKSPAEIAVSIMAELTATRRGIHAL